MASTQFFVLLLALSFVGTGWASDETSDKTLVEELLERGFQVSDGCADHKHGDQWSSVTEGINCACAKRRSLCYTVTCLSGTRTAVVQGRWSCVFDDDKNRTNVDAIPLHESQMEADSQESASLQQVSRFFGFFKENPIAKALFKVGRFIYGRLNGQQHVDELQDINSKLDALDQKVTQLSSQVTQLLSAVTELYTHVQEGNQWVESSVIFGRFEHRLRYLLDYLVNRLSVDGTTGELQPAPRAQEWADGVLSLSSDGVQEILFHLHEMMVGTTGIFGSRSLFLMVETQLNRHSRQDYWNQVTNFLEYVFNLQVSGNAAFALNLKGRSDEIPDAMELGNQTIEDQEIFLRPYTIEWPTGTYGLPRTDTGCPVAANVDWETGHRYQDTEDAANNTWSDPLHFESGTYWTSNLYQKFCMKTDSERGSGDWPSGDYCVFKKGDCPIGFQSGYILWDDEDYNNDNSVSGTLPDGHYGVNTQIFYCCRNDSSAANPIPLPSRLPFYLFRYQSDCQQVQNMQVTAEYFRWDDENWNNDNLNYGAHPYDDSADTINHRLWYCYYEPLQ